ncbi:MAG: class I lanthipeptide [Bacteroidetes bacterium]|jgi:hypothetical protein|nr:class I lanthipeptide [Bacteroidota bacterium]MBK9319151.1 class I lanthipeptide [Bacteroidota bacterium]
MKKSINKLNLNKMTISNLYAAEMHQMVGGGKGSNAPVICMPPLTKTCPSTAPATCSACNCTVVK